MLSEPWPAEPESASFGVLLRRERLAAGLTQEGLAERAGLSVRGIQDLERGASRPQRATLRGLAAALALPEERGAAFAAAARPTPRRRGAAAGRRLVTPAPPGLPPAPGASEPRRHNLPAPLTSFVGRERELAAVQELLRRPNLRLLTLTGPGGVGKTRLGLQVAAAVGEAYPDGVWLVELAALADGALVPQAVAAALGVPEAPGRAPGAALVDALRPRRLLLVLDNCEHLLSAAPLVAALLAGCPRLTALATSRAPLRVRGEQEFPVPPLAVPDRAAATVAGIAASPAVALFVAQAARVAPGFALTPENAPAVAALCRRLDGLPLALELAAARTKVLPPQALLEHLGGAPAPGRAAWEALTAGARDAPARQQTLRDTMRWSEDLLAPPARTLFRRLAVFAGGCTLAAAGAVCGGAGDDLAAGVLDGLTALVDNSLVQRAGPPAGPPAGGPAPGGPRFAMLETVREYALAGLETSGEAPALRARHAAHFHALALRVEARFFTAERTHWTAVLTAERDNLRAALGWALAGGDVARGLDTAAALRHWASSASLEEVRRWLERLLALPAAAAAPARARARALSALAELARLQGDRDTARAAAAASVALWRPLGDPLGLSLALGTVATSARDGADPAAGAAAAEALRLARAAGSPVATAFAHNAAGILALRREDWPAARAAYEQAAECARVEDGFRAASLAVLAGVDARSGSAAAAVARYGEALALMRAAGTAPLWMVAGTLAALGEACCRLGDPERAAPAFREALALGHRVGSPLAVVRALTGLGRVAVLCRDWARAAQRFGAAAGLATASALGSGDAADTAHRDGLIAQTQAALGVGAFAAAWAAGQALSPEQAVAAALEEPPASA